MAAGIETDCHLVRNHSDLFDAFFWPPNENIAYERFYIRIGTVPSVEAVLMRQRMETQVIPELMSWALNILEKDLKSPVRREEQELDLASLLRL